MISEKKEVVSPCGRFAVTPPDGWDVRWVPQVVDGEMTSRLDMRPSSFRVIQCEAGWLMGKEGGDA